MACLRLRSSCVRSEDSLIVGVDAPAGAVAQMEDFLGPPGVGRLRRKGTAAAGAGLTAVICGHQK